MEIKTPAFKNKNYIPSKFTCDGEDINPMIEIAGIPEETISLALIVDDPDATHQDSWNHWVVWNIDPKNKYIYENSIPLGGVQGKNDFERVEYGGPCPPKGAKPHRYLFKLFALDSEIDLEEGSKKQDLEKVMENHIIEKSEIIGLYKRN
ncbi:MAG: YbhB/YbcL family Raf kinase inhibitor-like protein [Candidatus Paceibacterota bacterium]